MPFLSRECGLCLPLAALLGVVVTMAWAEETSPPEAASDKALRERWQEVYQEIARSLVMEAGGQQLELRGSPLLAYTNPVRTTDQHGAIFLWTTGDRPALIGSIWSAMNRTDTTLGNITYEWHSLVASADAQASKSGEVLWTSGEPGIAWQSLPDAPPPAATRAARLVQMRSLARRLTASITSEETGELRLMPQPLYRYPESEKLTADGALFAFCLATDPEAVVLLETELEGPQQGWNLAIARFGNLAMAVKDGPRTLWSCDRGTPGRSDGRYYLQWRSEQRKADLTE